MTEIKSFNDATVKAIRKELETAIQDIASKYGLKASTLGNIGYNMNTMHTGKITLAVGSSQMDVDNEPLESFIGKRFKQGGRTFNITKVEDGKLLGITNRGARYLIRKEQLSQMVHYLPIKWDIPL
jgi:hypothetical protein